jgi:hypothetical protein
MTVMLKTSRRGIIRGARLLAAALAAAALMASCVHSPGGDEVTDGDGTDSAAVTTRYDGPEATLTLQSGPIRTLYCEGERLDPAGVVLLSEVEGETETVPGELAGTSVLKAGDTSAELTYKKGTVSVPVTVVSGKAGTFVSDASGKQYRSDVEKYAKDNSSYDNDWYSGLGTGRRLENPFPDGRVADFAGLADYVDYHVFYHISSVVVRPEFDYGGREGLLKDLYYRSGLIASNASADMITLDGGYIQIVLRYYDSTVLVTGGDLGQIPAILGGARVGGGRSGGFVPAAVDRENGITVNNSEQLCWALTHGYKVDPVAGSPAEKLLARATAVLSEVCSDGMTPFEKMYAVYSWFMSNTRYDFTGEVWAGNTRDPERESDMYGALVASFHAEGPLLYGNGVCYGFAKAYAVLLALEGLEVRRVTGHSRGTYGWSAFEKEPSGSFSKDIRTHSYLYVRIDGRDYLSDVTFSYAGTVSVGGTDVCWYRDMALAITKQEHAQVYTDIVDLYSESPDYLPASFRYQERFTYDGTRPLVCRDEASLDDLLKAALKAAPASGSCFLSVTVLAYAPYETLRARIQQSFRTAGMTFVMSGELRNFDGRQYYNCIVAARR